MSEFFQRVEQAVNQRHLFARDGKVLAAVSGGVDSMVLLHTLRALAPKHGWKLSVAHFNHRLRGRASDADERLVRQTAARLRLPFLGGGADVKGMATKAKISIEMAARKLRHEFLARTAHEHGITLVALAHHADDQVELFFLRVLRGAGGEGLAGMKWSSRSPADPAVSLVRPLLDFSKAELLAQARAEKIRFRDDATNFSADFLRNRIRNELLPLLRKKYQPGVDRAVLRLMGLVGAESELVSAEADKFCRQRGGRRFFDALPVAVQRKVLWQGLTAVGLLPDFELIEQLRGRPGKKVSVCAGLTVARDGRGKVRCQEEPGTGFNAATLSLRLSGRTGRGAFGGRAFRWRVEAMGRFRVPARRSGKRAAFRECFDADRIGDEVVLRHWQPGDRFQPIGLKSAAKLQDLFVNAKIPAARRRALVLAATAAGEIFWVEGLRIGERFKLTPQTRRKLVWEA